MSRTVTVDAAPDELYDLWRDPEQFSRILGHFADVFPVGTEGHRWIVHGPGGREITWQTRVVADEPGDHVRWETAPGATVGSDGAVTFRDAPDDRGTRVTLTFGIRPPGGRLGTAVLDRLDVVPATLVDQTLDRFKSLAETGEIPTLEGNPSGRGKGDVV